MQVGDSYHDSITIPVATFENPRSQDDYAHLLAESAESLIEHMERLRTGDAFDMRVAGQEINAMCQWVANLTYHVVKCAYVGIAQIHDERETLQPLAEAGQSNVDSREWWTHIQRALFAGHRERTTDAQLTQSPLVVQIPSQQATSARHTQQGRTVCAIPIGINGERTAVFAVEPQVTAPILTAEVMMVVRAMAGTAATALAGLSHRCTQPSDKTKALRAALSEMDDALNQVSHELKSPLTTIMGSLHLVEQKVKRLAHAAPGSPEMEETLTSIQDLLALASRYTDIEDRIATDLIDASRLRTAKLTLRLRPCDLRQIVQESVGAQRIAQPERIVDLAMPDHDILVSADADRLAQVVTNFLENALKYSLKDAPVEVRIAARKTYARVSVHDYGPGIEKSELKRVWQRFYRANASLSSHSATGLGLGLYIGREIIRGHKGRVGVTSAPGCGATFWFTLPLAT